MAEILKPQFLFFSAIVMTVSLVLCVSTLAQASPLTSDINTQSKHENVAGNDSATDPTFKNYKGVRIGMSADEVAEKLGEPAVEDKTEQVFLISDFEMVQVLYDKAGGVNAVSITYSARHPNPPTALAVLGEDVAAEADGRIYKLVRYPQLGYWVAYSRTAGEAPVVSVTMNKM